MQNLNYLLKYYFQALVMSFCTKMCSGPLMTVGEACCNQLRSQVAPNRLSETNTAVNSDNPGVPARRGS